MASKALGLRGILFVWAWKCLNATHAQKKNIIRKAATEHVRYYSCQAQVAFSKFRLDVAGARHENSAHMKLTQKCKNALKQDREH